MRKTTMARRPDLKIEDKETKKIEICGMGAHNSGISKRSDWKIDKVPTTHIRDERKTSGQ